MTCRTPKILLATAVASGLLLSAVPVQAHELGNSHTAGPVALIDDSPTGQQSSTIPGTPPQLVAGADAYLADGRSARSVAPESSASTAEPESLGLPRAQKIIDRYQRTAGNVTSMATTEAINSGGFALGYWGELTEEEEEILAQIEALWPQESDEWTDEQWEEFSKTETGQQLEALFEEFNALMLMKLPEESRLLLEAMEALLPQGNEDWDEKEWEEFYQTEGGQEFLKLLDEFYAGFFDDEDFGISDEEQAFWDSLEKLLPEGYEEWDEEEWEEFYQTEDGKEFLRLLEEFYGFDSDDEDQAFWDALEQLLPEGHEDWDDEAWDEYYGTQGGHELLEFLLTYELNSVESEQELEELLKYYREVLRNHSEWLEAFLLEYFETPEEPSPQETHAPPVSASPETEPAVEPTQGSVSPSEVVPVSNTNPSMEQHTSSFSPRAAAQESNGALAATGFTGLAAVGVGTILVALGILSLRLRRKAAHKA